MAGSLKSSLFAFIIFRGSEQHVTLPSILAQAQEFAVAFLCSCTPRFAGQLCGPESAEQGCVSAPLGQRALRAVQDSSLLGRIDWGALQVMCFLASELTSNDCLKSAHTGNTVYRLLS